MISTLEKTLPLSSRDDARWEAVVARDASFAGQFYIAVKTTGVYCRPGCPARLPKRANVCFFDTREDAERAGFRPCKRCKPDEPALTELHAEKIAQACRLIETAEETPKLDALAEAVGLSPYHFHRIFKQALGVTPKAYATAHRSKRARKSLIEKSTVTEAIYDAGFNSNGRFYANSWEMLGMTPSDFRSGASGQTIRYAIAESSLGPTLVAASEKGICAIFFGDDPEGLRKDLQATFPRAEIASADKSFEKLTAKVIAFVEAPGERLDLPLDIRGTAFQHRVWDALRRIPAGATASYAEIARKIGKPKAVRAVARACATNRIAVAIPCHRVIGSNGSLTGY
ncbi:MAG TPA: bifunctional DNA-binding transcriptional regulator/O6-methylguanine-DNA methyltransferase Ada, partial [Methyloceanibacter sp.]|nr:bifunctional DNA-binding transcriptional regulator/O6-methylguanine-DNA methyltransferase Ada [Methyloceanibacter sp.]